MDNLDTGNYADRSCYLSFQPAPILRAWEFTDTALLNLLTKAEDALTSYNQHLAEQDNADLFASHIVLAEASASITLSAIPSTHQANEETSYIDALRHGMKLLKKMPFSARFIREVHQHLQTNSLGHNKLPGQYRTNQTWVGGDRLHESEYIPPVPSSLVELMSDLELFINDETYSTPHLIKLALLHYQLESIHPFLDGNARLGRLLLPLYLYDKGLLSQPILALSTYFEANREAYIEKQMRVRTHKEVSEWVKFVLMGVLEASSQRLSKQENKA